MKLEIDSGRLQRGYETVQALLLKERNEHGHWTGELSTSALSTATAVMALQQVLLKQSDREAELTPFIKGGLSWLAEHQNSDGGWGDTLKSYSNISTTMLAHAVFYATQAVDKYDSHVARAEKYIEQQGGVPAVIARYGKDKTFSIPILTHCALAGLVDWKEISALPFELACLPHQFFTTIRLPVVSYALPALIAIGQVKHHFHRPWNPLHGWLRDLSINKSLQVLTRIQPTTGGFLEATPLTSFVTMSLAAKGLSDHPVAIKGVEFIKTSVLEDGSWPIDTNLATWVTTLSVNALGDDLPRAEREPIRHWLLSQQYQEIHPFTNAAPGGWAWTDLSGGVPDADDTPGAILALMQLAQLPDESQKIAIRNGVKWLVDLQNRDGGFPTFCRGWGALPFDRSSPDITAHCIRALHVSKKHLEKPNSAKKAVRRGFRFLARQQNEDGSWFPLWFGNQDAPDEMNPLYGTAKVFAAYRDTGKLDSSAARNALNWLRNAQNSDGGWGGYPGSPSTVEETALAVEALLSDGGTSTAVSSGLDWLLDRIDDNRIGETAPIGFYFAKLWYFERLYPLVFVTSALRRAIDTCQETPQSE